LQKMVVQNPNNQSYYGYFFKASMELKAWSEAMDVVKRSMRRAPNNFNFKVDYLWLRKQKEKNFKEEKSLENLIEELKKNDLIFQKAYEAFAYRKWWLGAKKTLNQGLQFFPTSPLMIASKIQFLRITENTKELYEFLIENLIQNRLSLYQVQGELAEQLDAIKFVEEISQVLVGRIQKHPNNLMLNELLIWVFIQKKKFDQAFKQNVALEKREGRPGERTFFFGAQMMRIEEWKHAERAFAYVIGLQKESYRYREAKMALIRLKMSFLDSYGFQKNWVDELADEFVSFFEDYPQNENNVNLQIDYAKFQLLYVNAPEKAIKILLRVMNYSSLLKKQMGRCKILLGDAYLVTNQTWDAQLLYGQVDKAFKEDLLGQKARLKNAKLSYYKGDFLWAKTQLNILKRATSRLIANDALELSVLISDNTGLDSTDKALKIYAKAELLLFQKRFSESINLLNTLPFVSDNKTLQDEILYLKAKIMHQQRKWTDALYFYKMVVQDYPLDILADNSLWQIANLYQNQLEDTSKAIQTYQKIVFDYTNSIFAVKARNKITTLTNEINQNLEQ